MTTNGVTNEMGAIAELEPGESLEEGMQEPTTRVRRKKPTKSKTGTGAKRRKAATPRAPSKRAKGKRSKSKRPAKKPGTSRSSKPSKTTTLSRPRGGTSSKKVGKELVHVMSVHIPIATMTKLDNRCLANRKSGKGPTTRSAFAVHAIGSKL